MSAQDSHADIVTDLRHQVQRMRDREDAHASEIDDLADRVNALVSGTTDPVVVERHDASAYCQILAALAFQEEGDAVTEVLRLLDMQDAVKAAPAAPPVGGGHYRFALDALVAAGKIPDSLRAEALKLAASFVQASPVAGADALTMNDHLLAILGRPNFTCIGIANRLRERHSITRRSEDEQAAVLLFLLNCYFAHGASWAEAAEAALAAMRPPAPGVAP